MHPKTQMLLLILLLFFGLFVFFVCNGPLWLAYHLQHSKPNPPFQASKTCFNTILNGHINHISVIVLPFHCFIWYKIDQHNFTLTCNVSPKPYICTTLLQTSKQQQ